MTEYLTLRIGKHLYDIDKSIIRLHEQPIVVPTQKNLSVGTGMKRYPDTFHTDILKMDGIDMQLDLEATPYPFNDNQFEVIYAMDVVEHIDNVLEMMSEFHRILKPNGVLYIHTGYWKTENSFSDLTHRRFPTLMSFDHYDPSTPFGKNYGFYTKEKFKIQTKKVDGQELSFTLIALK